jgi:hypothetical protein
MGKLLNLLGIDDNKQSKLDEAVFTSEELIVALQVAYTNETNESNKDELSSLIAEISRLIVSEAHK